MNQRDRVKMTEAEVTALIEAGLKLQLATINPDGTPHLVTMYYAMRDGAIVFWTYRESQKARNLARDPRVSCLVEEGADYFDLRGALIYGTVQVIDEPERVLDVGARVLRRMMASGARPDGGLEMDDVALADYVARTGRKRLAYSVTPARVVSWDHRKLLAPAPPAP